MHQSIRVGVNSGWSTVTSVAADRARRSNNNALQRQLRKYPMDRRAFLKHSLAATTATALGTRPKIVAAQSAKPLTIELFIRNLVNPVWTYAGLGADRAAQEIGGVTIAHATPTKSDDIEEQTRLVEDAIAKKPDGLVFSPVDFKALVPAVQEAIDAKIPVIVYANDMPDLRGAVSYIGAEDETIQYLVSKYLFATLGGKAKIVYLEGTPRAATTVPRKNGLSRSLKEFPGIELLASQTGLYQRRPALEVMQSLLPRLPAIDAVVCANDEMAIGAVEALTRTGRAEKTLVVGIDCIPDATALIRDGKILASADFSPHDQAYLAVIAMVKHLHDEIVPPRIIMPVKIATKLNVASWLMPVERRPPPVWFEVLAAQKKTG
jgi:ribose transport system substrate-binding protein